MHFHLEEVTTGKNQKAVRGDVGAWLLVAVGEYQSGDPNSSKWNFMHNIFYSQLLSTHFTY